VCVNIGGRGASYKLTDEEKEANQTLEQQQVASWKKKYRKKWNNNTKIQEGWSSFSDYVDEMIKLEKAKAKNK
jgi:hypothetical protein